MPQGMPKKERKKSVSGISRNKKIFLSLGTMKKVKTISEKREREERNMINKSV